MTRADDMQSAAMGGMEKLRAENARLYKAERDITKLIDIKKTIQEYNEWVEDVRILNDINADPVRRYHVRNLFDRSFRIMSKLKELGVKIPDDITEDEPTPKEDDACAHRGNAHNDLPEDKKDEPDSVDAH